MYAKIGKQLFSNFNKSNILTKLILKNIIFKGETIYRANLNTRLIEEVKSLEILEYIDNTCYSDFKIFEELENLISFKYKNRLYLNYEVKFPKLGKLIRLDIRAYYSNIIFPNLKNLNHLSLALENMRQEIRLSSFKNLSTLALIGEMILDKESFKG